jgi:ubiquinone/menaquinone biosynthesis C-methylase UbiE
MPSSPDNLYSKAGIEDLAEFYRYKFLSDEVLDQRYFKALDRFDIRFARTLWVFNNVARGSSVLDLGCGAGMLALIKRKGVHLVGVDISDQCALAAKRNGYDETFTAELTHLPLADHSFDYVVSLDVLGHISLAEKDAVLTEIKRVLRPGGVTMHGIESTGPTLKKSIEQMSPTELTRFVEVDGHVGLEEEQEHAARFQKFFKHVAWEPRYALCLSSEEFLKQADDYGLPFERDFLEYLRGLSFKERRAFDIAMGYVFSRISDLNIRLPKAGLYVFLKASDQPLGPFYNEHKSPGVMIESSDSNDLVCLDRSPAVTFDDGWYEPNMIPPVARWMAQRGKVFFTCANLDAISFDLTTHMPELRERPLLVEAYLNGERLAACSIFRYGWLHCRISVPPELASQEKFQFELRANRTWQPRPLDDLSSRDRELRPQRDDRDLSIAVCNIELSMSDIS